MLDGSGTEADSRKAGSGKKRGRQLHAERQAGMQRLR
jgi:hypothetical protein